MPHWILDDVDERQWVGVRERGGCLELTQNNLKDYTLYELPVESSQDYVAQHHTDYKMIPMYLRQYIGDITHPKSKILHLYSLGQLYVYP